MDEPIYNNEEQTEDETMEENFPDTPPFTPTESKKNEDEIHLQKQKQGKKLANLMQELRKSGSVKPRETKEKRAGLIFPANKILNKLKSDFSQHRVLTNAGVYLGGVLEYLSSEILDLAGDVSYASKRHSIQPRDIMLAIENDHELHQLLNHVQIRNAGINPFIHPALIKTKNKVKKREANENDDKQKKEGKATEEKPKKVGRKKKVQEKPEELVNKAKSPNKTTSTSAIVSEPKDASEKAVSYVGSIPEESHEDRKQIGKELHGDEESSEDEEYVPKSNITETSISSEDTATKKKENKEKDMHFDESNIYEPIGSTIALQEQSSDVEKERSRKKVNEWLQEKPSSKRVRSSSPFPTEYDLERPWIKKRKPRKKKENKRSSDTESKLPESTFIPPHGFFMKISSIQDIGNLFNTPYGQRVIEITKSIEECSEKENIDLYSATQHVFHENIKINEGDSDLEYSVSQPKISETEAEISQEESDKENLYASIFGPDRKAHLKKYSHKSTKNY